MNTPLARTLLAVALLIAGASAAAQSTRAIPPSTVQSLVADPLATPPSGSARAQVTIIDYFDYNCPSCRQLEPELRKLLAHDAGVRVIHKDWPVFGEASEYAAYCSFAAARAGKYQAAHDALISSHQDLDTKADVRAVLEAAGFDVRQLDADIAAHGKEYAAVLARNQRETTGLGLRGTPGLIVGDRIVAGAVDYPQLQRLVAQAHAAAATPVGK